MIDLNHKRISYVIGKSSYTKKIDIGDRENIEIMNKQLSLSIPLITGAKIENKKETKKQNAHDAVLYEESWSSNGKTKIK